jgi:hypothetical protein
MAEVTWLLKTPDAIFGPETEERLLSWAKAGKIQPGQFISTDGEEWTSVTEVPFLDMRWSIDIQDGKPPRGPFHRDAVDALLARGRLPENVKIIEVREPWNQEELILEESEDEITTESTDVIIDEAPIEEKDYVVDEEPVESKEEEMQSSPAIEEETAIESPTQIIEAIPEEKIEEVATIESEPIESEIAEEQPKQMELPNIPPDASILYGLMREEAESLAKLIADETRETEEFRKASQARQDRMQERRQAILRLIGSDADDMVRRARITHPTITRDANLRQDYNALRLLQERVTQEAKNKIDILTERLNKSELEARRLRQQMIDTATLSKQLAETRATLQRREKEIMAERQRFEEERQRFAMERQTLLSRLSTLETGLTGGTNQSREARGVKLAPWMGLIK